MSPAVLEREYSPSSEVGGDISFYLDRYAELSAKARRDHPCREDLSYGVKPSQVLDLFPAQRQGAPLFVFVHGGYWQELSQKESAPMATQVLAAGFAFAALDYTLAPQAPIEHMVEEIGAALAFLQKNADAFGYDARRITLAGHSAGAHLAAMQIMTATVRFDHTGLEHLLLISGIYDLAPIPLTSINDLLGLDAARARALSPMLLSPKLSPRVTVAVAAHDTNEFRRQSKDFAAHLKGQGCGAQHVLVSGRNHFDIIFDLSFASL